MDTRSNGKKQGFSLKKLLRIVLIVVAIILIMRALGLCSKKTDETDTTVESTAALTTDTQSAAESPSVYATKPVPTVAQHTDATPSPTPIPTRELPTAAPTLDKSGEYTDPYDVALYIHLYGKLPSNFISKSQAEDLGWVNSLGNLDEVAPGKSIGGTRFGNYEGMLPEKDGRVYYECDVNYTGGYRGGERLVYSNDGLIFYSDDHYESFTQLY